MIKTIEFTPTQFDCISTFLNLIEDRSREPTINKQTNINCYSIAVASNRGYKSVKLALKNLKIKFGA